MHIDVHSDLTNSGSIVANQRVEILSSGTVTNGAMISSGNSTETSVTRIVAPSIVNTPWGAIYGDTVELSASTIANTGTRKNDQYIDEWDHYSGVIAGRKQLTLHADVLKNTGGAQMLSLGDFSVRGALGHAANGNTRPSGRATLIRNESSTMEAIGDMQLQTAKLENIRPDLRISSVTTSEERIWMGRPSYAGTQTFGAHFQNIYYQGVDKFYLNADAIVAELPDV